MSFFAKLEAAAHRNETLLCIGLDPTPEACPSQFLAAGHWIRRRSRLIGPTEPVKRC